MNYFENCKTNEEAKKVYYRMAKKLHPDAGGNEADMKELNRQYEAFCSGHREERRTASNGEEYTTRQTAEEAAEAAAEFIEVIDKLLRMQGVTVELCGRWLWISGNTRPVKDDLKAIGCRWAAKKKLWYWHPADEPGRRGRKAASMEEIRSKYGSKVLSSGSTRGGSMVCYA